MGNIISAIASALSSFVQVCPRSTTDHHYCRWYLQADHLPLGYRQRLYRHL